MRTKPFLILLVCALATSAGAQVPAFLASGDIAAAGSTEMRIMDETGATSTGYPLPVSPTTILWDQESPDDFICGGGSSSATGGFLVRASFTAPGTVTSALLAPSGSFAAPQQISWDQSLRNIIVVTGHGQVHSVDEQTGAVTDITSGANPWGSTLRSGAMDPLTGDIYVGNAAGEIYRIAAGTGGTSLLVSGFAAIEKIIFDSTASPHYLYFITSGSLRRIELGVAPAVESFFGGFGQPTLGSIVSFDFDDHGDFVIGRSNDTVYRLPNAAAIPAAGIAPTFLGQMQFPTSAGSIRDVSVVGATAEPYRLTIDVIPVLGASFTIENVPEPLGRGWMLLTRSTNLPEGRGSFFGIVPDGLTIDLFLLPPTPGGQGAFVFVPPPPLVLPQLTMAPFFGETWDGVSIAFTPDGRFLGRSNVSRVTWQ